MSRFVKFGTNLDLYVVQSAILETVLVSSVRSMKFRGHGEVNHQVDRQDNSSLGVDDLGQKCFRLDLNGINPGL